MWGNSNKFKPGKIETLIGHGIEIHGDVIFSGGLHLDGRVVGNALADDGSESMLILSDHGSIEGDVKVPYIVLNGRVDGDVYASERIELSSNARVNGNVYYNLLEIAIGAQVNGSLVYCKNEKKLLEHKNQEGQEEAAQPANDGFLANS